MTKAQVETLLMQAPVREFTNGVKKQGLFALELRQLGVPNGRLKKMVRSGDLKFGYMKSNKGAYAFYSLDDLSEGNEVKTIF